MSLINCPNCGNQQEGGERCARCNSLFAYYADQSNPASSWRPVKGVPQTNRPGRTDAHEVVRDPNVFDKARKYYRVAQWVTLGLIVFVVVLILKKGTPPPVSTDPAAAARAEDKIRDSDVAQSMGQPHKLQLDSTELNSYLSANLAAASNVAAQAAANPAPVALGASPAPAPAAPAAAEQAPTIEEVQSSVRDVKVDMVGDVVKAYVIFDFHGQELSMELDGHIRAENGYLKFEPTSGAIGSMPLPASTLQSVADHIMDSPENREKMRLPAGVNNIRVVDGQVVVSYQ